MPRPNVNYVCIVQEVPITWFEIESWHADMLIKDRKKAKEIGDPYSSTSVCEKIAYIIYNEMVQKVTGRLGIDIELENAKLKREREWDQKYNKYKRPTITRMSESEFNYHSKEKWSSVGKFAEIMAFAKKKAYEQEYIKRNGVPPPDQQQKQKRHIQQPVQTKIIEWKKILAIPDNRNVDERMIKVCFRKLARKYHPDLQDGDETKMKEIIEARNEAYKEIGKL